MNVIISFSILLNVLLIGLILGGVMGGMSKPHSSDTPLSKRSQHAERIENHLSSIIDIVPVEKRKTFKKRIHDIRALKQTDKAKMREARKNILKVFEREPFDKVAYQNMVSKLNQLHKNHVDARVAFMADIAQYLSPKERRQLSRIIMRPASR